MRIATQHGYPVEALQLLNAAWWAPDGKAPPLSPSPWERAPLEVAPKAGFADAVAALQAADDNPLLGDLHSPHEERALATLGRFTRAEVAAPCFMAAFVARTAFNGDTSKDYALAIHAFGFSGDLGIALAPLLTREDYEDPDWMRRLAWATAGLAPQSNDTNGPAFGTVFRRLVGLAVGRVREECAALA